MIKLGPLLKPDDCLRTDEKKLRLNALSISDFAFTEAIMIPGSTSMCFGLIGEELSSPVICKREMAIRPPIRPPRITNYLKPYVLKMNFTNKYVSAQVIHAETATVASSASSQEKILRSSFDSTGDVSAASMIGKLLGERLLLKGIPAVSLHLKKDQKYHGKVKAMVDSLTNTGVKLL